MKAIIFDVDGTLYYQFPVRFAVMLVLILHNLFRPLVLLRTIRVIRCYRRLQEKLRIPLPGSDPLPDLQLRMTARMTRETLDFVQAVVRRWMFERPLRFLPVFQRVGLMRFIRAMKDEGLKLGIYSDYPCADKLRRMGLESFFSAVVSSFDEDVLAFKPAARGFRVCAERLGLKPEEILFIGDREEIDAAGANRCGMKAVLIGGLIGNVSRMNRYPRYRSLRQIQKELLQTLNA